MFPSPNDETLLFSNVDLSLYVDDSVNGSGIGTSSWWNEGGRSYSLLEIANRFACHSQIALLHLPVVK